ncbi:NIPSNAP family protein [Amycolatopsis sp. FU40]|uniref:putative quinol monooxygenase n=1 Tax=Amycolatopsis sp. FU40 TaxID=2914159 RepID=UPI001F34EBAE|nr:NIPSNAP family protein [Amycolatopsis sp. FU40]UKD55425.1 NIPSNAP family protein [Amycolatopsis sp. FU40]
MTVVELRQYTLRPGQRDVLIDLFDRELVEPQEAAGCTVVGQFRDEDDPDRFVWFRSFPDMTARHAALTAFYLEGEAWRTHRDAANATMLDSDDVLLLRPETDFPPMSRPLDPVESSSRILVLIGPPAADFAEPFASFVTEPAENTFRALPVREGENVRAGVWVFPDLESLRAFESGLATADYVQRLRLAPTSRSSLR